MEIETPDYLSYKAYKKMQEQKKKKQVKKLLFLFLTTFFGLLLIFGVIAQQVSPHIDLPENMDPQQQSDMDESVASDDYKGRVDSRLRELEEEEQRPRASYEYQTSNPNGQNMSISDQIKNRLMNGGGEYSNTSESNYQDGEVRTDLIQKADSNLEKQRQQMNSGRTNPMAPPPTVPPRMKVMPKSNAVTPSAPVPSSGLNLRNKINDEDDTSYVPQQTVKVMVGSYNTPSEARAASEKLSQSNSRVNPFIKELNGIYTIQVGSYSDTQKASEIATKLRSQSYSVKVVK